MINDSYKIKINNVEEISEFQIKMINKNDIKEFINFKVDYNNNEIRYDISKCKSVSDFIHDAKVIKNVIKKTCELHKVMDDYMLSISNLECSIDRIYIEKDYNIKFIYYPFKTLLDDNENDNNKSCSCYKKLITALSNRYVSKCNDKNESRKIQKIISNQDYKIEDLYNTICNVKNDNKSYKSSILKFITIGLLIICIYLLQSDVNYSRKIIIVIMSLLIIMLSGKIIYAKIKRNKEEMIRCGDTEIVYDSSYITNFIELNKIYITKDKFIIGKSENCDLIIKDKTISNEHAVIYRCNNNLFIKDLNSRNHTFVNGIVLEQNENVKLCDKDVIKFSSKKYRIHIR